MLKHLNPEQKRAVLTTEGRVLILAGAGSGKTSVLTHRMAYLIKEKGAAPASILGLTFTNKAASEMRERMAKLIGPGVAKQVFLGTFHSFCAQILRKEIHRLGYTKDFSLYDEKDVKRLLTQLARHLLEHEGELPSLEPTVHKISIAKNRGEETLKDQFDHDIFQRLESCMRAYNAVDFDSLLTLTVKLFEDFPELLKSYQERFRYVMIDEYQDTNPIQYRLASHLARGHNNLCVVGDDDQSIYGWRGAEIKNILQFSEATVVKLEQNYRSTPNILKAANTLIAHNHERHQKELWSAKGEEEPIRLFHAPSELEEAQGVINWMQWLHSEHNIAWKEMAILYRSNLLSRTFEAALMQAVWKKEENWVRGIPYQIFGGTEFYERSEIKDLMAYLKVVANPKDQEALLRIINVPRRGISDQTLDTLTQINRQKNLPLWEVLKKPEEALLSDRAAKAVQQFTLIIEEARRKFQEGPLNEALLFLLEKIDYKKAIMEDVKSDKMRDFKWENVLQCVDALKQYETEKPDASLQEFLSETVLDQERHFKHGKDFSEDRISLMTFHSAKGLEFEACFLVGLEDHLMPHEKSVAETGIEEERRLMYVALTRAKKFLTLTMARKRKRFGKDTPSNPSRFLFEIPQELLKSVSWQTPE